MPRSKTKVMPAIVVPAVSSLQAGPCSGGRIAQCGLCPLEVHCLPGGKTCPHLSMLPAMGTDLDTGPENAGFAASQVCTESWLGDLGQYLPG